MAPTGESPGVSGHRSISQVRPMRPRSAAEAITAIELEQFRHASVLPHNSFRAGDGGISPRPPGQIGFEVFLLN